MTSTNTNTDLRALANRPTPTVDLDRPHAECRTENDPVRKAAQDAAHAAGARYAHLEAGTAAELLAGVFPGAHRVLVSFHRDEDDPEVIVATLRAVWHTDGRMLWHSHGEFSTHPDAAARAELEAYGGPVMPRLTNVARATIETRLSLAEEYGRDPFNVPDEAHGVRMLPGGQTAVPAWAWLEEQGWLRELTVPETIAKAQQVREANLAAAPGATGSVWVCAIGWHNGDRVTAHTSEAGATKALAEFARQEWPQVADRGDCPAQAPADDDEVARLFFETTEDGWYVITEVTVQADEPNPEDEAAVERLVALTEELGVSGLLLGEVVHDMFSAQASDVNNGGRGEQVRCLVENFGADGAESTIREFADADDEDDEDEDGDEPQETTVACKLCDKPVPAGAAHRHDGGYVGECCWDERLNATA